MSTKTYQNLSDDEVFYSLLNHYLNDSVPAEMLSRFESLLQRQEYKDRADQFAKAKGRLAIELSSLSLNESNFSKIRNLAQGASIMTDHEENQEIENFANKSRLVVVLRSVVLIGLVCVAAVYGAWKLLPSGTEKFDPLRSLSYESLAIQEDPAGRMDLVSDDVSDVETFFAKSTSIDFKVDLLKVSPGWTVMGASVIDYDFTKVAVILYGKREGSQRVVHFVWKGNGSGFPDAIEAKEGGLTYRTYTNEAQNIITYKVDENRLAMVAGTDAAQALAKLASGN